MAAKGYVLGIKTKISWSGKYYSQEQLDDRVRDTRAKSVEALPDHVGEDVRNVLPEMGAEEQADSPDEQEVAIVMEIAQVIERG